MPFKVGYSILILPYPTRFHSLFLSLPSFNPQTTVRLFHSFTSRLAFCHWRHESHNSAAAESLHCDFSRDTSAPTLVRSLFSFMWENSRRRFLDLSGSDRMAFSSFSVHARDRWRIPWLFGYSRRVISSHHNRPHLSRVPSRVSCTQSHETNFDCVKGATESEKCKKKKTYY